MFLECPKGSFESFFILSFDHLLYLGLICACFKDAFLHGVFHVQPFLPSYCFISLSYLTVCIFVGSLSPFLSFSYTTHTHAYTLTYTSTKDSIEQKHKNKIPCGSFIFPIRKLCSNTNFSHYLFSHILSKK